MWSLRQRPPLVDKVETMDPSCTLPILSNVVMKEEKADMVKDIQVDIVTMKTGMNGKSNKKVTCTCCTKQRKSKYHWNTCSVGDCKYLTWVKDGHLCLNHIKEEEKAAMMHTTSCTRPYTLPTSTKVGKNLILPTGPVVNENMTGAKKKRTVGVIRDVVKRTVELDKETMEMPTAQINPARGGEVGAEEHEILVQRHVNAPQLLDLTATATQLRGQTATQTTDYRELLFYSFAALEYNGVEHIIVGKEENIVTDVVLECSTATCKMGPGETVWKTPSLPAVAAEAVLNSHTDNHMELEEEAVILDVGVTPTISVYHPGEEVDGSRVKKVHDNVANMYVVPKERGHGEVTEEAIKKFVPRSLCQEICAKKFVPRRVCQEATNKKFNITRVDSNNYVKNPLVEKLDEIPHENVVEMYMGIGTFAEVGIENPAGQAPLPQYIFIGSDGCPGPAAVEVPGHGEGVHVAQEYLLEGNGVRVGLQQDHRPNPRDVVHNDPVCQPLANNKEVCQVTTVSDTDRTGVDKCSRVVQGPLVELDMKVHTDVAAMYMVPSGVHGEVDEDHTKYNPPGGPVTRTAVGQESSHKQSLQCDQCKFATQLLNPSKAIQRMKSHINSQQGLKEMGSKVSKREKGDVRCWDHKEMMERLGHTNKLAYPDLLDEFDTVGIEVEITNNTEVLPEGAQMVEKPEQPVVMTESPREGDNTEVSREDTQSTDTEKLPIVAHNMEQAEQTAGTEAEVNHKDTKSTKTEELPILAHEMEQAEQTVVVNKIPVVTDNIEVSREATETHKVEQTVVVDIKTSETIMECNRCEYSTRGYKRGRLKMRLEYHLSKCKAVMPEVGEYHITFQDETNRAVEQAEQDGGSQEDLCLPADSLPGLIVMPGHIAQASQGRLNVPMPAKCDQFLTSFCHQAPSTSTRQVMADWTVVQEPDQEEAAATTPNVDDVRITEPDTTVKTIPVPTQQKKAPPDVLLAGDAHTVLAVASAATVTQALTKLRLMGKPVSKMKVPPDLKPMNTPSQGHPTPTVPTRSTLAPPTPPWPPTTISRSPASREKMFVSRPASSCRDDSATTKISLAKYCYPVEYAVADNVNYIDTGQVTARRFVKDLSRKASLVTPVSPRTAQRPVWPPPPRPDTWPPPLTPPLIEDSSSDIRAKVFRMLPKLLFIDGMDKNGHEAKNDDDYDNGEEEEESDSEDDEKPGLSTLYDNTALLDEDDEADFVAAAIGDVSSNDLGEDIDTGMYGVRMQEQLKTRRSVTLSKEVVDKSAKKFVEKPATPPPKMKIAIHMNIEAYGRYDPMLECGLTFIYMEQMMTKNELIQHHATIVTADGGAQANIPGDKHDNNSLIVADRFSGWQQLYSAQTGKLDGSRRMTLRTRRVVRELHQSGTGPLYKYLRYEIPTTVGALTEVDGNPQQPTATVDMRELHLGKICLEQKIPKPNTELPSAQTIRQPATKFFPPPPATMLTSTTPTRSPARREDLRLGIADIAELCKHSVAADVHEQVNDREPAQDEVEDGEVVRHQDDCGVAVQEQVGGDGDVQEPGGDEEVPKEMSKRLRRPNVIYSTEEYDLSSVKTRSRRQ
jgi:hypothetical protein